MKKMIILLENGVEDSEFIYPYFRFQEEGYQMIVVAPKEKTIYTGKHGLTFTSELSSASVDIDEYEGVVVPGGHAPDRMRLNKGLVNIVKDAYAKGKVIAAVCHGPQLLIEADIVRGKTLTGWNSIRTDLRNAGAKVVDEAVVIDGNIVSSRSPFDLPAFCKETVKLLSKLGESRKEAAPIPL
jgi:protease I